MDRRYLVLAEQVRWRLMLSLLDSGALVGCRVFFWREVHRRGVEEGHVQEGADEGDARDLMQVPYEFE